MTRRNELCALLIVMSFSHLSALAQAKGDEPGACAQANIGSAVGAGECFTSRLSAADADLSALEATYAGAMIAASPDPAATKRVVDAEASSWRAHRATQCRRAGETEGGSQRWQGAMTTSCELDETNARIALLHQRLAAK